MSIEKRIKRIEDAIKHAVEHRDWLASDDWLDSRKADEDLGRNLDDAIDRHDQQIEAYNLILSKLRMR